MSNKIIRDDDDSIYTEVLTRSSTDRAFRERLVSDPEGALEEVIGVPLATLPRPINVKFIEKEAGYDAVVVLPDFMDVDVLSDAELEAVAGGAICVTTCWCTACCITNISVGFTNDEMSGEQ
ncbi:MAG TPA: hypothetical protein VF710_26230 [Longimicrobium sp.]|jgi:hypothetical protein